MLAGLKVALLSGGFDYLHPGHLSYIESAIGQWDIILIALSRDDQLREKDRQLGHPKGREPIPYEVRKALLEWGLKGRAKVVQNVDRDITCCDTLRLYHPDVFVKGGDTWNAQNLPEASVCEELGIEIVFGVGGHDKPYSSSQLGRPYNSPPDQE